MTDWSDLHPNLPPDLHDLLNASESETSVLHPLELPIPRDQLLGLVHQDLDRFRARQAASIQQSTDERHYLAAMIQQRLDMLAWLREQPEDPISMSIFSTREDLESMTDFLPDTDDDSDPGEEVDLPF